MPRAEFELRTEVEAETVAQLATVSSWIEFDEKQAHMYNDEDGELMVYDCAYTALHDVELRRRYQCTSHAAQGRTLALELR